MYNELNPFDILGVATDAGAPEIRSAYEKLKARLEAAKKTNGDSAKFQLQQIEAAFELLSDKGRRAEFTAWLKSHSQDTPFKIMITPSKRVVETLPEPQVVYLLMDIIPEVKDSQTSELEAGEDSTDGGSLNLTLVLDQSNSMKGARMERVKAAATEIINQMSGRDYLSVVGFNDRATVIIEATQVENKKVLASRARMARAMGGTEILQGLRAGLKENRKHLSKERVNHIILLTDGRTYGDEEECILLANTAAREGISISTLGLGSEWNDQFLDDLASITGGASGFIKSANSVVEFMNNEVEKLANVLIERVQCAVVTDMQTDLEMTFKLKPSPQPVPEMVEVMQLGGIPSERMMSILFQIQIPPNIPVGFHDIARIVVTGDYIRKELRHVSVVNFELEVAEEIEYEDPPEVILDALGKLTLYNMQERANEAMDRGDVAKATERLQNLATRLLDMGHQDLANETMKELNTIQLTNSLSDEGRKSIKYQTRHLMAPESLD